MPPASSLWFTAPRTLEYRSEALPDPGPGEVRVRALASALSHGTEMLVYRGQVPTDLDLDLPTLAGGFAFPIKYGYASVGRVEQVGSGVAALHEQDMVFALHPHQDAYVLPANLAVRLPDGVSPERGVFVANLETAVTVLLDAHPRFGERVLISGQGVVGLLLTQLVRQAGAGLVMVVDPIPGRRALALELGASVALAPEEVAGRLPALTRGVGADVVIEASGHPAALQQAIDSAAFQGTVVVSSWYGTKPVTLQLGAAFHRRRLRLVSSQVGHLDPALSPRWDVARRQALVLDLLQRLPLERLITHRVPFTEAARAYELVDTHPEETAQVVLTYPCA